MYHCVEANDVYYLHYHNEVHCWGEMHSVYIVFASIGLLVMLPSALVYSSFQNR